MRILMASHSYPPIVSGVTLVVQKVARAMVERGHHVTIITGSDHGETYKDWDQGVELIRVRGAINPWWKEAPIPVIIQRDLEEIIDAAQPDVVHAQDAGVLGVQLARLNDDRRLPRVASCYFVPRFAARYVSWSDEPQEIVENITLAYSIWLYNHFDRVVFSTAAHEHYFLREGLEAPSTIISNGVDTIRYRPGDEDVSEVETRYNLPTGPRILFVSRLAKDKEIDVLIRAMPRLSREHGAHLLLIGRGDQREELEELSRELDMEHWVHFLGFVPEADLPAIYRASDLFAIVSTTEVQSIPTLQAAATALPLVAADAMALPELVHDGTNGFLVPPQDPGAVVEACSRILADRDMASRMGQESYRIALAHSESRTFDKYESLYKEALAAGAES